MTNPLYGLPNCKIIIILEMQQDISFFFTKKIGNCIKSKQVPLKLGTCFYRLGKNLIQVLLSRNESLY